MVNLQHHQYKDLISKLCNEWVEFRHGDVFKWNQNFKVSSFTTNQWFDLNYITEARNEDSKHGEKYLLIGIFVVQLSLSSGPLKILHLLNIYTYM